MPTLISKSCFIYMCTSNFRKITHIIPFWAQTHIVGMWGLDWVTLTAGVNSAELQPAWVSTSHPIRHHYLCKKACDSKANLRHKLQLGPASQLVIWQITASLPGRTLEIWLPVNTACSVLSICSITIYLCSHLSRERV